MAEATREIVIQATPDHFYGIITGFRSYPEFVPDVVKTRIVSEGPLQWRVEFTLKIIKEISYTLDLTGVPGKGITWKLAEPGSIIRSNVGAWELTDLGGGKLNAKYVANVDVAIPRLIPGASAIVSRLIGSSLPAMLEAFKGRAEKK